MNTEQLEFEYTLMDDTDSYVFKSHNLIESGYNFTLNEQRLTYLASRKLKPRYIKSNIKPSQMKTFLANETFKDIRIYVNEFKKEFNLNSNNLYKVLKDTANSLYEKEIRYMNDDGTFKKKRWVITCSYNPEGKYVELTFHPDLILDLLILKGRFGKMNYNSAKEFKTTYSFRIYELLQNYLYKGERTFEIEDFRYKLGIYDDNKYKKYSDFRKYVIDPSIKCINESSDLNIDYEENRYGRKVGAIKFNISQKTLSNDVQEDIDVVDKSQVKNMEDIVGIKLSAGLVEKITNVAIDSIRKYKIDMGFYEYIEYEMERVRGYAKSVKVNNIVGCLIVALKEYWKENETIEKYSAFKDYDQRQYSDEELKNLENGLLGWDND